MCQGGEQACFDCAALECFDGAFGIERQHDFFDGVAAIATVVYGFEDDCLTARFDEAGETVLDGAVDEGEWMTTKTAHVGSTRVDASAARAEDVGTAGHAMGLLD